MRLSAGRRLLCLCLAVAVGAVVLAQELPEPNLFDADWEDRSQFATGLQPALREEALSLPGAPVYHLDWTLENRTSLIARQEVRVVNYSSDSWSELYFLLLPNRLGGQMFVQRVSLNGERVVTQVQDENRLLRVALPARLEPGDPVVVAIDYRLAIPESGGDNYGILAFREEILSLAHGYALLAVYDAEGWDLDLPPRYGDLVYARSSFFRVRLNAPLELQIAASGRRVEWRAEKGRQQLVVVAGPVRDFYLFASEALETVVRVESGITVRGYALPGTESSMAAAVETTARALATFAELYGRYPFRELDVVPITTSALGVEFPGIIALRRELFEQPQGDLLESTVVHEVAHQWFYSLVGNDQVSEPWLDESVTQYLTLRYYLEEQGQEAYLRFRQDLLSRWEQIDRERVPIGRPVAAYSANEYGAVIYGLGPLVVESLSDVMGPDVFDRFLLDYVEEFGFGLATTSDFRRLAEQQCECSLEEFFGEWIGPAGTSAP